jgi:hypothetical protein
MFRGSVPEKALRQCPLTGRKRAGSDNLFQEIYHIRLPRNFFDRLFLFFPVRRLLS